MKIKILVLNVKDGDAIIIQLSKEQKHFVILIDGGHSSDEKMVLNELNVFLSASNKKAPDLVVCTHYDSDHIGGMKAIINHYKKEIHQVLIHRTTQILELPNTVRNSGKRNNSIFPSELDLVLEASGDFTDLRNDEGTNFVLESIRQEIELIAFIDHLGISCQEPIAGRYTIEGWEEFQILGPTLEYYAKLFPEHFDAKEFLIQEAIELKDEKEEPIFKDDIDPCELLSSLEKSKVTRPNLNSAIISINVNGNSFLFTGDAGIESFENIPNYKALLSQIFWLKVPHHGSRNNINCELIKLMSPKYAVISGNKYVDESVIGCLRTTGSEVLVTKELNGNILYSF